MRITLSTPLYIQELGKRSNQEDSYFMSEMTQTVTSPFFMVCDGMGGHDKGEVASALVCQSMSSFLTKQMGEGRAFDDTLFAEALDHTYAELDQLPIEGKRPGTTLTFLCCHRQGVTTANIGDSRIYHIRPKEGKVLFQSRDHSMVFDLYLMGELSLDEMATSPQKNVITKALMPGKENHHRADMVHIGDVQPDDCFLLCSDGMLEHITNDQLIDIFSHCDDMEKVRQMLIDASVDSADNHTAILLKVASVEQEEGVPVLDDERSSSCNALNVRPMKESATEVEGTVEEKRPGKEESAAASPSAVPQGAASQTASSQKTDTSQKASTSQKPSAGQRPAAAPRKKSKTPLLTIILAVLLVAVLAAIGVLLFKKSPKPASQPAPQQVAAQPAAQQGAPAPTDSLAGTASPSDAASATPSSEEAAPADVNPAPVAAPSAEAPTPASSAPASSEAPKAEATPAPRTTPNPTPAPRTTPNPAPTTKSATSAAQQRRDNLRDRSVNP